jgi:hypothetical protein
MSEVTPEAVKAISTPDRVESRLGTLEFDDGAPSEATAALLYDHLDFVHGVQAFLGALPGASLAAMRRGFQSVGVEDNSFTFFPELMDSASVFLTANSDTVYFWGFIDLSDGRRDCWGRSMTCGSAGSPTSAFPARTVARGAGI